VEPDPYIPIRFQLQVGLNLLLQSGIGLQHSFEVAFVEVLDLAEFAVEDETIVLGEGVGRLEVVDLDELELALLALVLNLQLDAQIAQFLQVVVTHTLKHLLLVGHPLAQLLYFLFLRLNGLLEFSFLGRGDVQEALRRALIDTAVFLVVVVV
jgi:hypothetical protein